MLGSLISAASSFIGGLLGDRSEKKAQKLQIAESEKDRQLQKDFAQQGIRWRAEDAKAAGIHPLFAMGASIPTYSPTTSTFSGGNSLAAGIANAGQDIGRSIDATRSVDQKFDATMKALTVQKSGLENELLASQIARLRQGTGPAMPTPGTRYALPGQGDTAVPGVEVVPQERTGSPPGRPSIEPGDVPDVGFSRTNDGWAPVPSNDVKQRIEDNIVQEVMHAVRNNVLPSLGVNYSPPNVPLKKDHFWYFDPLRQEYRQVSRHLKNW